MNGEDLYKAMNMIEDKYLEEIYIADENIDHSQKKLRGWKSAVLSAVAAFILVFVGVVNLCPTVAIAMNDIILLGDLAKAVTFDPSMRACLENEYAQYVGEKQLTKDGHYSKVYYMVVDASRISFFYKTDVLWFSEDDKSLYSTVHIEGMNGEDIGSAAALLETGIDGLYEYQVDFIDEPIPEELRFMVCYVDPMAVKSHDVSEAVYTLYPEEQYRSVVKCYDINKDINIFGQKVHLDKLEVYPTQAKLCLKADEENSAYLQDISILLKDDRGKEYTAKTNGLTGTFNDKGNVDSKWYESTYFSKTGSITIEITAAEWIPIEKRYGSISYDKQTIENIPEGVTISEMKLNANHSLTIEFRAPVRNNFLKVLGNVRSVETGEYCDWVSDEEGRDGYSVTIDNDDEKYQIQRLTISNFRENAYEMEWDWGIKKELEEPVEILVK